MTRTYDGQTSAHIFLYDEKYIRSQRMEHLEMVMYAHVFSEFCVKHYEPSDDQSASLKSCQLYRRMSRNSEIFM